MLLPDGLEVFFDCDESTTGKLRVCHCDLPEGQQQQAQGLPEPEMEGEEEDGVEFEVTAAGSVEEFDLDAFKEGVAEVAGVDVDRVVATVTPASVKVSVHINAPDEAEQEALTTKLNEKLADADTATKALKVKVVGEIVKAKIVHPKKMHAPGARRRGPPFAPSRSLRLRTARSRPWCRCRR